MQFKYYGNALARISEDELVMQAVQALPTMYHSTVVGVYETERCGQQVVTLNALWMELFPSSSTHPISLSQFHYGSVVLPYCD
jgi:hypothetical protein